MIRIKTKEGFAYLTALVLMLVFSALGLGLLMMTRTELTIASNQKDDLKYAYYAESGLAHAIADIQKDPVAGGNISATDLDGDGQDDYMAIRSMGMGEVEATGFGEGGERVKTVKAEVKMKTGWTGAIMSGGNIVANIANAGNINGNVDAIGTENLHANISVNGIVSAPNPELLMKDVRVQDYAAVADYTYNGPQVWHGQPPDGDGVYYINSNLTISGVNGFTLYGSIIVRGSLTIQSMIGDMLIQPSNGYPALLAGGTILMTSCANPYLTINGLIFARGSLRFVAISGQFLVDGAIAGAVSQNAYIEFNWVNNLQLNFNEDLDPPFFTGGDTGLEIDNWQGH